MEPNFDHQIPLGRVFANLTKQYIGLVAHRMKGTPIEKHYYPLWLISQQSGRISQQQLADQLLSDKVTMVRMLDCLANAELIVRQVNPDDRRQHLLSVTEKGKAWIPMIEKAFQETQSAFLAFVTPEFRATFESELRQLSAAVMDLKVEKIELIYNRINNDIDETN